MNRFYMEWAPPKGGTWPRLVECRHSWPCDHHGDHYEFMPAGESIGFEGFVSVCRRWLEHYPAEVFTGESGDSGPVFVAAIRKAIERLDRAFPCP